MTYQRTRLLAFFLGFCFFSSVFSDPSRLREVLVLNPTEERAAVQIYCVESRDNESMLDSNHYHWLGEVNGQTPAGALVLNRNIMRRVGDVNSQYVFHRAEIRIANQVISLPFMRDNSARLDVLRALFSGRLVLEIHHEANQRYGVRVHTSGRAMERLKANFDQDFVDNYEFVDREIAEKKHYIQTYLQEARQTVERVIGASEVKAGSVRAGMGELFSDAKPTSKIDELTKKYIKVHEDKFAESLRVRDLPQQLALLTDAQKKLKRNEAGDNLLVKKILDSQVTRLKQDIAETFARIEQEQGIGFESTSQVVLPILQSIGREMLGSDILAEEYQSFRPDLLKRIRRSKEGKQNGRHD